MADMVDSRTGRWRVNPTGPDTHADPGGRLDHEPSARHGRDHSRAAHRRTAAASPRAPRRGLLRGLRTRPLHCRHQVLRRASRDAGHAPAGRASRVRNPTDGTTVLLNTFTPDLYVQYFRDLRQMIADGHDLDETALIDAMRRYATEPATDFA